MNVAAVKKLVVDGKGGWTPWSALLHFQCVEGCVAGKNFLASNTLDCGLPDCPAFHRIGTPAGMFLIECVGWLSHSKNDGVPCTGRLWQSP